MKTKLILALTLVLSACSSNNINIDPNTGYPIDANLDNPNHYYNGANPYGTDGVAYGNEFGNNPYGTGGNNPYGPNTYGDNGYGGNNNYSGYDANNAYGGSATAQTNRQAGVGDYYQDPNYGVNPQGGPQASSKDRVIYFSYDSSAIDSRARAVLQSHANYLRQNPQAIVILEGHTDERGTRDYNIALGERRAYSVKNQFEALGVRSAQMRVLSYGEERPAVWGSDEQSYARNRRVVIIY